MTAERAEYSPGDVPVRGCAALLALATLAACAAPADEAPAREASAEAPPLEQVEAFEFDASGFRGDRRGEDLLTEPGSGGPSVTFTMRAPTAEERAAASAPGGPDAEGSDAEGDVDTVGGDGPPGGWRLADAASPWLRARADDPVTWRPWGEAALDRARRLDRPVFLYLGGPEVAGGDGGDVGAAEDAPAAAMERRGFRDAETAALLDAGFVAVLADRAAHPHLDARVRADLAARSGTPEDFPREGPLAAFLTPDGRAFAGATGYPLQARDGRPGFSDELRRVAGLWRTDRVRLLQAPDA